jgi:hypothetical protein
MVMVALLCGASGMRAQQAAAPAAPAAAPAPDGFMFGGKSVILMWQIKPEAAADFASTWGAMKAKLAASEKPDIKELGESLHIYKVAAEGAPAGSPVIFVFELIPSSKTLSYDPGKILFTQTPGAWERKDADVMYTKIGAGVIVQMNVLPLEKVGG